MAHSFVARLGASSDTTQKILMYSYTNATPTVTCSGGSVAVGSWVEVGTDKAPTPARACYAAVATITGLTASGKYTWTASQTEDWSGSFQTLAAAGAEDTFSFFTWTCDAYGSGSDGCLEYILEQFQREDKERARFIIKQDDVMYLDDRADIDDSAGSSGLSFSGRVGDNESAHDYAVAAMAYHGMIDAYYPPGSAREELWKIAPSFEMWGDHEIDGNFRNSAGGAHDLQDYDAARSVWDAMIAQGMPDSMTAGTYTMNQVERQDTTPSVFESGPWNHLYFGVVCGQFCWFQMDRNSYACADESYATANSLTYQLLGSTQLFAAAAFLAGAGTKWKMFCSSNSLKPVSSGGDGAQEPWLTTSDGASSWTSECQSFIDTIDGNAGLNGTTGNLIYYRGNDHNAQVHVHDIDALATSGTSGANLWEFTSGPVTHGGNHTVAPDGSVLTNTTTKWTNGNEAGVTANQSCIHWTVYGSEKIVARFINQFGEVIWTGTMTGGNEFVVPTTGIGVGGSM